LIICSPQNIQNNNNSIENNNSLMNKTMSKCNIKSEKGYFINSMSKKTNELIYCKNYYECEDFVAYNGYFVNNYSSDIIKCVNSECEIINQFISSCKNYTHEVIYHYNHYYCDKDNKYVYMTDIYDYPFYYEVEDIDASSIYPNINNGSDKILLKITRYSVTQYISDKSN